MPDMVERYPFESPGVFASGTIQSEADSALCVDTLGRDNGQSLGLYECHGTSSNPKHRQNYVLSWHRNIRKNDVYDSCLDTYKTSLFVS
jgi:polypeptide N-acetylgalactosaminyltransferase